MSEKIKIKFTREDGAKAPSKAHETDTGYDLYVWKVTAYTQKTMFGIPHVVAEIDTGIACEPPAGCALEIRPKSRFCNTPFTMPNSPGTIDHDYRGHLIVKYRAPFDPKFILGTRLLDATIDCWPEGSACAQLVVAGVANSELEEVYELGNTERGEGGFGSTEVAGH